jgi:hypothetical protein
MLFVNYILIENDAAAAVITPNSTYYIYINLFTKLEVMNMNVYLEFLQHDIDTVQELSHVCRGEWCRLLEPQVDALQDEVIVMQIRERDFAKDTIAEMSVKLRDTYRHLGPQIRT